MFNFIIKNKNSFIISLVVTFLLSFYLSSFSSSFKKGFPAPIFTLKTIEGETFNLKDFKEKQKLLILYFYSEENEDSIKGIEKLAEYFNDHITKEKYQIFLVNSRRDLRKEDIALIKEFWANKEIEFPILLDELGEVNKLCKIEILPTTIFLDKNLVVKRIYSGLVSKQQSLMFQYINYLLDCEKRESPVKKEKKEEECEGPCEPLPGW